MTFGSILSERAKADYARKAPNFFVDLNLDQIAAAVIAGKEEYDLSPFFYTPLGSVDAIKYRHEVFQDLENGVLLEHIKSFAQKMRALRDHLTRIGKLRVRYQKEAWVLNAVETYCDAVMHFEAGLSTMSLQSRGFLAFHQYIKSYAAGTYFTALVEETNTLKSDFAKVLYSVLIKDNAFTVRNYNSEVDYSEDVEKTFEKFKQGAVKDYRVKYRSSPDINHIV